MDARDDRVDVGGETHTRREALRKAAVIGAAAGAASITGISIVPGVAQAASGGGGGGPQITANGTADKNGFGCFSGAGGDDQFLVTLGDGWWHFYFQGCGLTESVALADPPGGPSANAYEPPTGYKCKMQLLQGMTVVYDTGYVSNPINGIADTGGYVFIGTGDYPNGYGDMDWQIICDPI
ncbi:MAG: hypothetical protein K1X95_14435 [Acidimicrobiia bacterium]|nr:hypothetical protein [Acidimicrobiia bacterium]